MNSVPNSPREGRTNRSFRVDDADWQDLEDAAAEMGTERGELLRQLIAWLLRRPGAELPERPR